MAACADCHQAFAGTPWRYNSQGQRVHCDCAERPPEPALGGPGEPHWRRPSPGWADRQQRSDLDQVRWRQIAQQHASWSTFARALLKQRYPIRPAQGAALDRMHRRNTR